MKLTLLNIREDFDRVEAIWCELSRSANVSYFLSWGWIEHWIRCLPEKARVQLAVFSENGLPVLAFFVGRATALRHGTFYSRALFLNASGLPAVDRLHIEYNAMLHAGSLHASLSEVLALLPDDWDEFLMPGLDVDTFPGNVFDQDCLVGEIQIIRDVPSFYVDLELVRRNGGNYVALLSSKMRSHVRRSQRGYERRGPILLEVASDLRTALEIFDELALLHQKTWQGKGEVGAFSTDFFRHFHEKLIRKRFDSGEIQMLRTTAGNRTIGCLYNFVFNGKVYGYQSGLNYESDKHLTPGYTSFVKAVEYNAAIGNTYFDFLGGDAPYKRKLCTNAQRLIWGKVQKPRLQFKLETGLKALKHGIQALHI